MGTPEFAVASLQKLVDAKFNIVAVVTAVDKPQGRSNKPVPSPVKECALSNGIPVLQPPNLKAPEFLDVLKSYHADLQIVVAFRMLPEVVWSMPPMGTFNLHASLLPDYRGAAPINWAIINGEKQTGVTTFFLKHEIDTGSVIFQEREPIHPDDTVGTLYDRLMLKGADLVVKTVQAISSGDYKSSPQREPAVAKHAPKIFKETCVINWNQPAESVHNFVRGLSPYPAAWCELNGKTYKIFKSTITNSRSGTPGTIDTDNKHYLRISTSDFQLSIEELQAEGKKKMNIQEFFRGNKF